MSLSHIWVQNGLGDATNKISVGWHVAPHFYGDTATYIYTSWTSDNFKNKGCFNLYCSGFVQTNPKKYIGSLVTQTSTYGGPMVATALSLAKDPNTQNWWLNIEGSNIGYFPAKLFPNMSSADQVGWGGRTLTPPNTPSPRMGSGYFPDKNFGLSCYFRQVSFQNESRTDYGPPIYDTGTINDNPNCFGVEYYGDLGRKAGYSLQFGGPGGECGN
ncbi:protein neprosin-like [Phaseolus vulgaris]|uniref:protein neprosin-like n=1 Tax=Phaseolus vulgaris TaxID=3885 RepID=UPI0035CAE9F6